MATKYRLLAEVAGDADTRDLRLYLARDFERRADEREAGLSQREV